MDIVILPGLDGTRWACTEGLGALGQQDFAVTMCWDKDNWREGATRRLLEFLGSYVEIQAKRIHAGETMRYGWTSLIFRESTPEDIGVKAGKLVVGEIADPLHDREPEYIDGAERAIILRMLQGYTAHRFDLDWTDHPHRSMFAIVCKRINPHGGSSIFLWRRPIPEQQQTEDRLRYDSRWLIGCTDREHAHNEPSEVAPVHLSHMVESYTYIFPYLALPDDSSVVFEGGKVIVYRPNDPEPHLDTAEPFTGIR